MQFSVFRAATSVHGRTNVRRNTVDPSWEGEEFHFSCSEAEDAVEIEIKDKFAKSRPTISRNLGRDGNSRFYILHAELIFLGSNGLE